MSKFNFSQETLNWCYSDPEIIYNWGWHFEPEFEEVTEALYKELNKKAEREFEKILNDLSISFEYDKENGIFIINERLTFCMSSGLLEFTLSFPRFKNMGVDEFNKKFQKYFENKPISSLSFALDKDDVFFTSDTMTEFIGYRRVGFEDFLKGYVEFLVYDVSEEFYSDLLFESYRGDFDYYQSLAS